jgi:hypothetical protein
VTEPTPYPDPDALARLRAERAAARDAVGVAAARLATQRAELRAVAGRSGAAARREPLTAETERAAGTLRAARAAEADLRRRIDETVTGLAASPLERIATLDARRPVAFLPVRLETRFRRGPVEGEPDAAGALLVRIYPDTIQTDQHEPLLTGTEIAAGRDYWRRAFRDGNQRAAWTALLTEATTPRAAWIVERTSPENADEAGGGAEPVFADIDPRPDGWHRAPEARGLPERWIVTALRAGRRLQVTSEPVREGLALTLRLSGDGDDGDVVDLSGDRLEVEPELAWVYDFDEAVAAGMAVRLPLSPQDLARGFETLLVVGVRTGESAGAQADLLTGLLDAHRYSRGLAFVPQGTKTNNTAEQPSDYPPADPAGTTSFPVARGAPLARPGTDGHRTAAALGVLPTTFHHVLGADRDEQTTAAAMADALWPATMGYAFDQLLAPLIGPQAADAVRSWLRAWVRPRGPLPALRVGGVPYGILPVGSLVGWSRRDGEGDPDGMVPMLTRLEPLWARFTDRPPQVGRSADPDRDLVELLAMDASTQSARVRRTLGFDALWNVVTFSGAQLDRWDDLQRAVARDVLSLLDRRAEEFDPRALYLSFAARGDNFRGPMVADDPLSEHDPLPFDYVAWLRTAPPGKLRDQAAPPTEEPVTALLYLMLRHAVLAEYDRLARRLLAGRRLSLRLEDREPELIEILAPPRPGPRQPPPLRTVWERFDLRVAGVTGDATLGDFLADPPRGGAALPAEVRVILAALDRYRDNLRTLEGLPTGELHRLFTETVDLYSHRLDAWVTSLATRRLAALREQAPRGVYLGCYGWVEDLRPDPPADTVEVVLNDGTMAQARTDSGGFVYAPSMLHGATAAVLRSAFLSRSGPDRRRYRIDLSSRRVRTALSLLDAVRASQPLGAVLGHQFERGLHEGHPGVELDRFIDTFRALYPQVANKAEDSEQPAPAVAARTVVDGLRLLRAWRARTVPFGEGELPGGGPRRAAIEAELDLLEDAVDALSDLLLAESVFQVVKGSPAGAAATLDSLAKGQRPPEPEVATVPRGGTVLHQRVALLLGDGSAAPGWGPVPATPRSAAAPEVNAWLGRLLGPPASIECRVTVDGGPARAVNLRELRLQPIDLVLMVQAAGAGGEPAELERRIAWQVAGPAGPDRPLTIDYQSTVGPTALAMAVSFELAAAVGRLLGLGRALDARDLLPPELDAPAADPMAGELADRAAVARAALAAARDDLAGAVAPAGGSPDPGTVRAALVAAAACGVPGAFPTSRHAEDAGTREALLAQAASVMAELERRLSEASAATGPVEVLRAVFGRDLPVMPRFRPAAADLLGPALDNEPRLGPEPDATVEGWLAQLTRVRQPLDAWRDVRAYARALGRAVGRPRIVQLPLERDPAPARWAALPFAGEADRPRPGLVSLALLGARPPRPDQPWAGLLLDAWPELIPAREEDAGVVFHFDAPGAEAPQAVLLAVPRAPAETWSYDDLEATLLHTLRLAKIRALDLSGLGEYGQLIPMTFLAANSANEAVSTSFSGLLVADPVIARDDG